MTGPEPGPQVAPLVLALVGTDHHRFDRVVGWLDEWARDQGHAARVVVQHGTAGAPVVAEGVPILGHDDMIALVQQALVVVTHGGPATISEVRSSGRLPLVVPRDPALGEHVDSHQKRFSRRLAADGLIRLCEEREQLFAALEEAFAVPADFRVSAATDRARVDRAVQSVGVVLDELIAGAAQRRSRRSPTRARG